MLKYKYKNENKLINKSGNKHNVNKIEIEKDMILYKKNI